jgi:hypothetical protein
MAAPKGHKKWGGKKQGSRNKKTLAWEELGEFFTTAGAERARDIMLNSNDKDFIFYFDKLLEFFKPKLQRTDITTDGEKIQLGPPPQIIIKLNGKDS